MKLVGGVVGVIVKVRAFAVNAHKAAFGDEKAVSYPAPRAKQIIDIIRQGDDENEKENGNENQD